MGDITHADREAAWPYNGFPYLPDRQTHERWFAGYYDNSSQGVPIRAFADHRKAAEAQLAVFKEALQDAIHWHEQADKALSKTPNPERWQRHQHQEQVAIMLEVLEQGVPEKPMLLSDRVAGLTKPNKELDVLVEVALFEPYGRWVSVEPAVEIIIATDTDGRQHTMWPEAWTKAPKATAETLRAKGL